ncbi:hypothetical protein M758_1G227500 [Ceratodon purpureus]|uniref:Uncharacterized protein n=1 Tax=Ceratodon purpureus TaxID=3225 RepID=A0A8T0JA05_CERPU|nr:hypothetical protein KC19_1G192300 [Ceratodon purpureus]KAG0631097.1 hypothetical protein M758_1G227500 [Ceratodon purpureus]
MTYSERCDSPSQDKVFEITEDLVYAGTVFANPRPGSGGSRDSTARDTDGPIVRAAKQYCKFRGAEILTTFLRDLNSSHSEEVHAEAVRRRSSMMRRPVKRIMRRPVYAERSMESYVNGGLGHQVAVQQQLGGLPSNARTPEPCLSSRQSFSGYPQSRWLGGGYLPVMTPFATQEDMNPTSMVIQDYPSRLRHPFDGSIVPVMYALNRAPIVPEAGPSIQAHHQPFSAPNYVESTAPRVSTSPIDHPVQEGDLYSVVAGFQNKPPTNMVLERQLDYNHPSSSNIDIMNDYAPPVPSMSLELCAKFNYDFPGSPTISAGDYVAPPMSMASENHPYFDHPTSPTISAGDYAAPTMSMASEYHPNFEHPSSPTISDTGDYGPPMSPGVWKLIDNYLNSKTECPFNDDALELLSMGENDGPPTPSPDTERQIIELTSPSPSSNSSNPEIEAPGSPDSISPTDVISEPVTPDDQDDVLEELLYRAAIKKPRLSWTPELVTKFEDAVKELGGPIKSTPKTVQRLMGCPDVAILNVKSRLQKYRMQADSPPAPKRQKLSSTAANTPTTTAANTPTTLDLKTEHDNLIELTKQSQELARKIQQQNLEMIEQFELTVRLRNNEIGLQAAELQPKNIGCTDVTDPNTSITSPLAED